MHKLAVSDPTPPVSGLGTCFILVSLVPSIFLVNENSWIILYSITQSVNLAPKGENLYIWLRQLVNSFRMSEPVVCENLTQLLLPLICIWFPRFRGDPRLACSLPKQTGHLEVRI